MDFWTDRVASSGASTEDLIRIANDDVSLFFAHIFLMMLIMSRIWS